MLTCFKAYDIRGRLGRDLDAQIALRIGRAFALALGARRVVLGQDVRESSPMLADAVAEGLMQAGATVLDIGLCGTEEVYDATAWSGACGGICITASHNPADWNGMKMVQRGAAPVGADSGLDEIRRLAEADRPADGPRGSRAPLPGARAAYVARVLSFVDPSALPPLSVLVNSGNGAAGPTFDAIAAALEAAGTPLRFVRLHHAPDRRFPNGIPNPLLPENQPVTGRAVVAAGADLGVAWDGDFDRCFLFDHRGRFVPGEYVVGLLAEAMLARHPGAAVVHDPRVVWATRASVARAGGRAVQGRTGHSHMKAAMRASGAVYGGEMSAHHYFRDFHACDSGMIPWLLVAALIGRTGRSLADLVADARAAFPSSGEINFRVPDPAATIARVRAAVPQPLSVDETDGLSQEYRDWRFNVRASNTEPLLRLNVETRADPALLADRVAVLSALIG
ncbi:MAG: phosphomannomutase [Gemmobacter sp.]